MLHHVELWVPDIGRAGAEWGWLLEEMGYRPYQEWPAGRSWRLLFPDRHPYAGGEGHCAAYLENGDGFEVELVVAVDQS